MAPPNFQVKTHPAMPVLLYAGERPHDEYDGGALDIRAVGVGPLGTRMAQLLSRNLPGVTCHEIVADEERESSDDIAELLSSLQKAHLVFVLTEFDDDCCESVAQTVGRAACEAGVLTLVVTPRTGDILVHCSDGRRWCDAVFGVSDRSLPEQRDAVVLSPDSLTGFSMRHVVAVITNLITHRTGICIDFADITTIMKNGSVGRMGVGIASDDARGATAAERAIERLGAQGIDISSATGVLASMHGSGNISMADFDAASKVIHEQISPDANVLVGVISDENLGGFVKVTLLSVH